MYSKLKTLKEHFYKSLSTHFERRELEQIWYILLEDLFGWNKMQMLLEEIHPSKSQEDQIHGALSELIEGRPIQYITGKAKFCELELTVNEHVLIPRVETEELVLWIASLKRNPEKILDIGTGSGCIALALASMYNNSEVSAMDKSAMAIDIARMNGQKNSIEQVTFYVHDIFDPLPEEMNNTLDLIVSNPPYIELHEASTMARNVLAYEPHLALFVPDNEALMFYDRISTLAKKLLKNRGELYFEIHEAYAIDIVNLLNEKGFDSIEIKKDMQGKNRMLRCIWIIP